MIRVALIVRGFVLDGKHIEVFDENPLKFDRKKSESIVIKDLPATLPPHVVMCRIWHPSQENFCKRCSLHGHRTIDVELCDSFEADCVVAAFRAYRNPLSNYYMLVDY